MDIVVGKRHVAGKCSAVDQQHLVTLSRQQHRRVRTGASGADNNSVIHGSLLSVRRQRRSTSNPTRATVILMPNRRLHVIASRYRRVIRTHPPDGQFGPWPPCRPWSWRFGFSVRSTYGNAPKTSFPEKALQFSAISQNIHFEYSSIPREPPFENQSGSHSRHLQRRRGTDCQKPSGRAGPPLRLDGSRRIPLCRNVSHPRRGRHERLRPPLHRPN